MADEAIPKGKNVWLRAFYGFNPEEAGYIGFTHEADRETMFGKMQDGDLVLIYGAVGELTDDDMKRQALGFLEIELERCSDRDRMNQSSIDWKIEHEFENRWTYGIKVRRAWRVNNRVHIRNVAPEAYRQEHRFERTTKAILLTQEERMLALSHTVRQVNVYGEPPVTVESLAAGPMGELLKPSQGIPPSFGERQSVIEDGETKLYLMLFSEPAVYALGDQNKHAGQMLVKVGRSNDPKRRLGELNGGFPETAIFRWKLVQTLSAPDALTAHKWEDELKYNFAEQFCSQGGEFFTGKLTDIKSEFHDFCIRHTPKIRGAAGAAKGVRR